MFKVTSNGISQGEVRELSEEDQQFIREMFDDFEHYETTDDSLEEVYSEEEE